MRLDHFCGCRQPQKWRGEVLFENHCTLFQADDLLFRLPRQLRGADDGASVCDQSTSFRLSCSVERPEASPCKLPDFCARFRSPLTLSNCTVPQLEQRQGKKPNSGASLVHRNPSLLIRRIRWLWHFLHTMCVHSARLQDDGGTNHHISQSARNIFRQEDSPLQRLEGNSTPCALVTITLRGSVRGRRRMA